MGVETVMTAGNGFLLDCHKPTLQAKASSRETAGRQDEDHNRVVLLNFQNGRYRIALGMTRIMRAVVTAQEPAIPT